MIRSRGHQSTFGRREIFLVGSALIHTANTFASKPGVFTASKHRIQPVRQFNHVCRKALDPSKLISIAKNFYEDAWSIKDLSGLDPLIDKLVAEDHSQEDAVWQKEARIGRESLKKGIKFIRNYYPDARFTVKEVSVLEEEDKVFTKWIMYGTYNGKPEEAKGVALLTVRDNVIARTEVYRQATQAEIDLSQGKETGPVPQGALLKNG